LYSVLVTHVCSFIYGGQTHFVGSTYGMLRTQAGARPKTPFNFSSFLVKVSHQGTKAQRHKEKNYTWIPASAGMTKE